MWRGATSQLCRPARELRAASARDQPRRAICLETHAPGAQGASESPRRAHGARALVRGPHNTRDMAPRLMKGLGLGVANLARRADGVASLQRLVAAGLSRRELSAHRVAGGPSRGSRQARQAVGGPPDVTVAPGRRASGARTLQTDDLSAHEVVNAAGLRDPGPSTLEVECPGGWERCTQCGARAEQAPSTGARCDHAMPGERHRVATSVRRRVERCVAAILATGVPHARQGGGPPPGRRGLAL